MQRARFCAGLGIGLMLSASSTFAGQVELSVENRIGGDSNVFRSQNDPQTNSNRKSDGTYEISPRIGFRETGGDLHYLFDYIPTHRTFFETSGIDGFDHIAHGNVSWLPSPIDRLEVSGSHFNTRQIRTEDVGSGAAGNFNVSDRQRIRQSNAEIDYEHSLSPILAVGLTGDFYDFDAGTNPQSQTDSRAYTGQAFTRYKLGPLTEVGLTFLGRLRQNRAVGPFRVTTRSNVWNVLGSVSRTITPTMNVSLQVGPSIIRQQQFAGGAINPSTGQRYLREEDFSINVFASASATKQWQTGDASLSYVRSEQRSGSVATGSSISDQVQLNANHRLNDNWVLRGVVLWNRLDQLNTQEGNDARFVQTFVRSSQTVEWAVSRRITLIGRYTYVWQQNETSAAGFSNKVNVHLGYFGIRYTFEPLSY